MSFRDNLQHLRATRNMTQEQLAMLVGVSRQSVTKWEAERAYPEMDKLLKLCQIFDCTLDDLVTGDLTQATPDAPAVPQVPAGPPTDVCGYDEHMRRFAWRIALGVALIIVGIAAVALADALLGSNVLTGAADAVSAALLFVFVGAGLALIIPVGMEHTSFVREHPYVEDFYTSEQRAAARRALSLGIVGGIICIFVAIVVAAFGDATPLENITGALFLVLVAGGVFLFVYFGLMASRVNVAAYNRNSTEDLEEDDILAADLPPEQRERLLAKRRGPQGRKRQVVGAVCGTIMLVATIVALLWLFGAVGIAGDNWDTTGWAGASWASLFWLPWPIGGICCGIATMLIEAFWRER